MYDRPSGDGGSWLCHVLEADGAGTFWRREHRPSPVFVSAELGLWAQVRQRLCSLGDPRGLVRRRGAGAGAGPGGGRGEALRGGLRRLQGAQGRPRGRGQGGQTLGAGGGQGVGPRARRARALPLRRRGRGAKSAASGRETRRRDPSRRNLRVAAAATTRLDGISASRPRRRPVSTESPRRGRGDDSARRNLRVAAAAPP